MGHGIAQIAALAGYATRLTDANAKMLPTALKRVHANLAGGVSRGKIAQEAAGAALERLDTVDTPTEAVQEADLVIEAIVEDLDIKQQLFHLISTNAPDTAVLASNTSSLSIAAIASATFKPERVVGMHFFNPVHIMKLLEVVRHEGTDDATVDTAVEVGIAMGKEPIVVRDRPGFASSRLGLAIGLEAMRMVEEEVALPEAIDKAMKLGYGHPMGPLELSDLVGLDVRLSIAEYLHRELEAPHFEPPQILRDMVERGDLGKKSGKGFYEWPKTKSS
jgi:3-hydroxybutyryl-CoA dehydrogenase